MFVSSAWGGVAELEKKGWVQPAELKRKMKKNCAKIRWAKKICVQPAESKF